MLIKTDVRAKSAVGPGASPTWLGWRKIVFAILFVALGSGGVFWGVKQAYYAGYTNELKYVFLQMKFRDVFSNYFFIPN